MMMHVKGGVKMPRYICMSCGTFIVESAASDPYMCRDCEKLFEGAKEIEKHAYLENYY